MILWISVSSQMQPAVLELLVSVRIAAALYAHGRAESIMRMLLGPEGALPLEQAKPWRAALHEVMKPQIVMRLQLPIMAALFQVRHPAHIMIWNDEARADHDQESASCVLRPDPSQLDVGCW